MQLYRQPDTPEMLYVLFTAPIPVRPSRSVSKKLAVTVQNFQHKGRSSWTGAPVQITVFLIPKIRRLSNSKKDRPSSEASSSSACQVISRTSCKSKVHYRAHNSSSLVPIPSLINPLHALPSYFLQLRFNIIIPSIPRSFKWSLFLKFPYRNSLCIPSTSPHVPPILFSLVWYTNNIWWTVHIMKHLALPSSPLFCYIHALSPNASLSSLLLNTVNICSSLNP